MIQFHHRPVGNHQSPCPVLRLRTAGPSSPQTLGGDAAGQTYPVWASPSSSRPPYPPCPGSETETEEEIAKGPTRFCRAGGGKSSPIQIGLGDPLREAVLGAPKRSAVECEAEAEIEFWIEVEVEVGIWGKGGRGRACHGNERRRRRNRIFRRLRGRRYAFRRRRWWRQRRSCY